MISADFAALAFAFFAVRPTTGTRAHQRSVGEYTRTRDRRGEPPVSSVRRSSDPGTPLPGGDRRPSLATLSVVCPAGHVGPGLEDGVAVVETQTVRVGRGRVFELHRERAGRRGRPMRKDRRSGGDPRRRPGERADGYRRLSFVAPRVKYI